MRLALRSVACRMVALAVALALGLGGPLTSVAGAQQPSQPMQPPGQSAQQPDLFKETLKASESEQASKAYDIGAGVVNAVAIPGKVVLCTIGGIVSAGLLIVTFGTGYKAAAGVVREGCGGKWIVTGDDLRPERQDASLPSYR